jgi:hypothetical protein
MMSDEQGLEAMSLVVAVTIASIVSDQLVSGHLVGLGLVIG